jgi:hypothetical protein
MDSIDHYVMEAETKRLAALTVFDNFIGYLKQIHGEIVRIAAEKDATERLAATEKARLQTETERLRKELSQLALQTREAKRELERTHKQNEHDKQEVLRILDSIKTKAVA